MTINFSIKILSTILKKPANTKTEAEISTLMQSFEDIKFFSEIKNELPEEALMKLHREIRLEYFPQNNVVFHFGDLARKFYIILRGSVYVLLQKDGIDSDRKVNEPLSIEGGKKKIILNEEAHLNIKSSELILVQTPRKIDQPLILFEGSKKKLTLNENETHLNVKSNELMPTKLAQLPRKSYSRNNKIELNVEENEYFETNYPEFYIARVMNCGEAFGEIALRQVTARFLKIKNDLK